MPILCDMDLSANLPFFAFPVAGVMLGLIIGSFLATLVVRWPKGQSVLTGRSKCDACERQLTATDLIPVISHIWQKGKCRTCGVSISKQHLAIELVAGLIGGIALFVTPNVEGLMGAIFGWILLGLAALDAEHQWLPDRLTIWLAATGLMSVLIIELPPIVDRLIGGLLGYFSLLLIALIYRMVGNREGLGGGDPKMLGGIGFWLGWQYLPFVLLGASAAGLLSVLLMKFQGKEIKGGDLLPLGSLMAIAAFPIWLIQSSGMISFG